MESSFSKEIPAYKNTQVFRIRLFNIRQIRYTDVFRAFCQRQCVIFPEPPLHRICNNKRAKQQHRFGGIIKKTFRSG